jgi:hypothetical protein
MRTLKTTPILNDAYEVVGVIPGLVGSPIGLVDLSKITVSKAEQLVDLGFPYLKKASPKPKKKKIDPDPDTLDED